MVGVSRNKKIRNEIALHDYSPDDSAHGERTISQIWVFSDFRLKRPSKKWYLFALSIIEGADNQLMTVHVRQV